MSNSGPAGKCRRCNAHLGQAPIFAQRSLRLLRTMGNSGDRRHLGQPLPFAEDGMLDV